MGRKHPEPTNKESLFKPDEIFFSSTDLKGIILSGNDVFQRISKYSMEELLGSPHNIIRHPDMPKIIFKLLWDYIQSGKSIVAYVKNLAKDGNYYWALATIIPIKDKEGNIAEYISIRIKPTTKFFEKIPPIYEHLLHIEKEKGMEESYEALMEIIKKLGYKSYDDFMKDLLSKEVKDKLSLLKVGIPSTSCENIYLREIILKLRFIEEPIEKLFSNISQFENLRELFDQKSENIYRTSDEIRLTALNSSIESMKLGSRGSVFSVISSEMRKNSEEEGRVIAQMKILIQKISENIKEIVYTVSLSKIEIVMFSQFLNSLIEKIGSKSLNGKSQNVKNFVFLIQSSLDYFKKLSNIMEESIKLIEELNRNLRKMNVLIEELEAIYFRGLIESGYLQETNFPIIFNYVKSLVNKTKMEISQIENPLVKILDSSVIINDTIENILDSLEIINKDLEKLLQN
ncbi:methyl-accepting chemotaxis protein [Persephonella sp.]